ncbi:MAG: hypothetical protein JO205_03930 [Pseudolabrys sp.]|nr:hypothetical protein [Pseudolabrys sp.]
MLKFWQVCALAVALSSAAEAGPITVYTALEEDEIAEYAAAAKKSVSDVELKVLRLSTGDLGARILAEASNLGLGRHQNDGLTRCSNRTKQKAATRLPRNTPANG